MIEHLRGREKELEPLGWSGPEAEWIALVCLHSGIFTRPQFCFYFDTGSKRAHRFVKALVERRTAVESDALTFNGGAKACLISGKPIYRALGSREHPPPAKGQLQRPHAAACSRSITCSNIRALGWLPTEPEKVGFFEKLGVSRRFIPRRIYYGALGEAAPLLSRSNSPLPCDSAERHLRLRRSGPPNG